MGNGSTEDFIKDMNNFKAITFGKVNKIIKGITIELFKSVIEDTPVDSGRAKSSWVFSDWAPKFVPPNEENKVIQKGARKGQAKKTFDKTGLVAITRMSNGIKRAKGLTGEKGIRNSTYFLTNATSYIHLLEYGGYPPNPKADAKTIGSFSTQAVGGFVGKNLQRLAKQELTHYAIMGED